MANTKITNHIVDKTLITGQTAVTAADGDYLLVADASDSSALKKVLASDLIQTSEEVADIVGAMVSSNTESGITVAYEDSDNTIDFTIGTLNQNTTGSAATLTTARTIGGTSFDGSANIAVGLAATATALATSRTIHGVGFDGTANIDLSEVISDTVGAMFSSNTETNITATYQDSDNTIDLVVDAAQPNVTSLGTLTTLTVDDIIINGTTIGHTSDTDSIAIASNGVVTFSQIPVLPANSIDSDYYVDGSIDTAHIADDQVTGAKLANNIAIAGTLDVAGAVVFNEGSADVDFRVESNINANSLFVSGETGNVGIGGVPVASYDGYDTAALHIHQTQGSNHGSQIHLTNATTGAAAGNGMFISMWSDDDVYFTNQESDGNIIFASGGNSNVLVISDSGVVTSKTSANISQVALTSASTVTWDARAAANAMLVPGANLTIGSPSNSVEGAVISVEIAMNGTPRTIAWHTVFEFAASTAPVATATANKTDIFSFRYNGSVWQEIGRVQNMAQT